MANIFQDYRTGNDANTGLSQAQRVKTLERAVTVASDNDTIRVAESAVPTALSQNLTFLRGSGSLQHVILENPVTTLICDCEESWTPTGSVSADPDTSVFKQGASSIKFNIPDSFGTGMAAFFAVGSLNLSSKQQVSFWIRNAAGEGDITHLKNLSLRLCSDAAGVTTVNTIAIPDLSNTFDAYWIPIVVDLGHALDAGVQSIALYVDTDNGAVIFNIDWIFASGASSSPDSITLNSQIGWSESTGLGATTERDTWYSIASIDGTDITLDNQPDATSASYKGWNNSWYIPIESISTASPQVVTSTNHGLITGDGVEVLGCYDAVHAVVANYSGAVTKLTANTFSLDGTTGATAGLALGAILIDTMIRPGYKREPIVLPFPSTIEANAQEVAGKIGLTISGGWNSADMTVQNSETWYSLRNGTGYAFAISADDTTIGSRIGVARALAGVKVSNLGAKLRFSGLNNCSFNGISNQIDSGGTTLNPVDIVVFAINNGTGIIFLNSSRTGNITIKNVCGNNQNGVIAFNVESPTIQVDSYVGNNGGFNLGAFTHYIIGVISGCVDVALTTAFNCYGSVRLFYQNTASILPDSGGFHTFNSLDSLPLMLFQLLRPANFYNCHFGSTFTPFLLSPGRVYSKRHNGVSETMILYTYKGQASWDSITKTWSLKPIRDFSNNDFSLNLSALRFICTTTTLQTVTVKVARDDSGLTAKLVVKGGQIVGVPNDVEAVAVGTADGTTFETLTLTFTPTEIGAVEVLLLVYGGTTFTAIFKDLQVNGLPAF